MWEQKNNQQWGKKKKMSTLLEQTKYSHHGEESDYIGRS